MHSRILVTKKEIKSLCGLTSFSRGENYFLAGKVKQVLYDPKDMAYYSVVQGSRRYEVTIWIDEDTGDVEAECDCPAFEGSYYYCKHIAAVLLKIEKQQVEAAPFPLFNRTQASGESARTRPEEAPPKLAIPYWETQLADQVLSLFSGPRAMAEPVHSVVETEEPAVVEFLCRITNGYRSGITLELRIGTSRRQYVVQKIRDFFDTLDKGRPYSFSKLFVFHPDVHRFAGPDEGVLALLMDTYRNERIYREMAGSLYAYPGGDRGLLIPPSVWEKLYPLLAAAPRVRYELDGRGFDRLEYKEGRIPLHFELAEGPIDHAYRLKLEGLLEMQLFPQYGFAVTTDGRFYRMDQEELSRMSRLQSLLGTGARDQLTIAPAQVHAFMQQVVPALRRMGNFRVVGRLSERVVSEPLKAAVYLDREEDRLTAIVEFAYGEERIRPLQAGDKQDSANGRLVMRDAERERLVLDQLHQAAFREQGEVYVLADEGQIYDFLFTRLAGLQLVAEVFATPSVDGLRTQRSVRPRAAVDLDSSTNWLEVRFELEGVEEKELVRLLHSLREKKPYHRLSNGAFVSLKDEPFLELGRLFDELGIRKAELKGEKLRLPVVRGLSLQEHEEGKGSTSVRMGKSLRQLLGNLKNPDNLDFAPPASLAPVLRDYQRYGFQWLSMLGYYGFGGILADDMGLGKTLQTIAYLTAEREREPFAGAPALIVCPASLVYNWRNELARFAPQLKAAVVAGAKNERDVVLSVADEVDVLITSYPVLRRDIEWYEGRRFHTLVLDEAQAIKNSTTQTAQAVKSIAAARRFALTGTPVENRLEELWSIYDAVFPELFAGRKSFTDLTPEQVARRIRPFLLRRLKADVLTELPDKIETLQTSELLPEQKKLYMAYLMQLQDETAQQLQEEGFQKSRIKILAGLTRLRQICCHPSLFVESYEGQSGKLDQLLELLEECLVAGKRMLVFSQFTGMLGLIRAELERRGWAYFYLDGSTKASERVELCQRFNEGGADLFLISLKAGGTGLNLTGADTVILYDLWWNPAVEQQAADRAHRIGQKNVVQVIRLLTEGTIEEKMYELQQRKKDLIDAVIQPGEEALSTLTEDDIRELLTL